MREQNFWQGKRVRLRAIEPGDVDHFVRWNLNSERGRLLDFLWSPQSETAVSAWVTAQSTRKLEDDAFHWLIENLAGEAVGSIGTHACNPRYGTFSYGLDIAPEHQRNGYASEAIQLVLRYYFAELRYQKVTVAIHSDNPASMKLHHKLGFVQEGAHRRMMFTNGRFIDVLWFGLTIEEFYTHYL